MGSTTVWVKFAVLNRVVRVGLAEEGGFEQTLGNQSHVSNIGGFDPG